MWNERVNLCRCNLNMLKSGGCCHTDCCDLPVLQLFLLCVRTWYIITEQQALPHCVRSYRYTDLDLYGGNDISSEYIESTNQVNLKEPVSFGTVANQLFNSSRKNYPTFLSCSVVTAEVFAFCKSFWCNFTVIEKCCCCPRVCCTHFCQLYLHLGSV